MVSDEVLALQSGQQKIAQVEDAAPVVALIEVRRIL